MTYLKLILFLIFNFLFLEATTYEDSENATTSNWKRVNSSTFSSINNIHDKYKRSRVIEFKGIGTKEIYELHTAALKSKKSEEYWVSWDMNFSEDFVIILLVQSNLGKHYLIYTPGTFNSYMQYGLGEGTTNGQWRHFRRNIQKDIAYYDNRVKIVSLKSFVLKGNGMIDNIRTTLGSQKKTIENTTLKKRILVDEKPEEVLSRVVSDDVPAPTSSSPVIKMQGSNIIKLNIGESYVEVGVSAYDKEDGEIEVVTMENIDTNEVGRYMVLYMATDSEGNIGIDKRYVDVGDVKIKESDTQYIEKNEEEVSAKEEYEEVENELGEEEALSEELVQMKLWERKLALREKELAKMREEK